MNVLKKRIFAAIFASAIIISNAMCVMAATPQPTATTRPRPGTSSATQTVQTTSSTADKEEKTNVKKSSATDNEEDKDAEKKINVSTVEPVEAVETIATASEKKYTTKGGAFGWFVLSVLVNAVLSFAIANRFYKMSKKDNHIASEIRALRRDVEERFASTVNGFYEQETDMTNQNDDYSSDADGIKMTQKPIEKDESAEEIFKKWENDLANQRAQKRAEIRASISPRSMMEDEDDEQDAVRISAYQPNRRGAENIYEDEGDYEDYEEEESKFSIFKSKAKEFITEVFPLKED